MMQGCPIPRTTRWRRKIETTPAQESQRSSTSAAIEQEHDHDADGDEQESVVENIETEQSDVIEGSDSEQSNVIDSEGSDTEEIVAFFYRGSGLLNDFTQPLYNSATFRCVLLIVQ